MKSSILAASPIGTRLSTWPTRDVPDWVGSKSHTGARTNRGRQVDCVFLCVPNRLGLG